MTDTLTREIPVETENLVEEHRNSWSPKVTIDEAFDTPDKIGDEYKRRYAELQEIHGLHWLPWDIWFPIGEWYRNQHTWLVEKRHKVEAIQEKEKKIAENPYEIICDTCDLPFFKRPTRGRPPKTCYTCKPR